MTTALDSEHVRIETCEALTIIGRPFQSRREVICALFDLMLQGGYVHPTYLEAVTEREEKMPTGLQTQACGIAIPHSDPEHVLHSAIAIALLDEPVMFKNMANPTEDVPVRLVLLLAIAEKGSITSVLASLAEAFLNPAVINHLLSMKTSTQLSGALSDLIHGRLILEE